jgi:hypothetical protein
MSRSIEFGAPLEDSLVSLILQETGCRCVIHGGHYALSSHGGSLRDHLSGSPPCQALPAGFTEFSRRTWELACRVVARTKAEGSDVALMVLVNDWQFVSSSGSDRRTAEQMGDLQRRSYYEAVSTLPAYYLDCLRRHELSGDSILKAREDRWLFSESELRALLPGAVRELEEAGLAIERGLRKSFSEHGQPIVSVDRSQASELGGEMCLLYCGTTGCSGEVVQLLKSLYDRGVGLFLNIYPEICRGPVTVGTEVARQAFLLNGMRIRNIALSIANHESKAWIDRYDFGKARG